MKVKTLINKIAAIEKMGTRVASFDYNGVKRNVIIGANTLPQGKSCYRSIAKNKHGEWYMVPRVMNDSQPIKAFRLDRISNFRCASVSNIK
jgi:hypothetical protein